MTYVVALTGGIGSGKSTVANFFSKLGVPVIDADLIARDLVKPQTPAYLQIVSRWGQAILQENNELNRHLIRERVFSNGEDKIWLESLLHPLIRDSIQQAIKNVQYPYCVIVIPLLAERFTDYQAMLNEVIVIDVMPEQQLSRTLARDASSKPLVEKIIASQASQADRLKIAQTILSNHGDLDSIEKKVHDLHQRILKTSISGKI